MRYGIAIDTERCMACYNCFMACRDEHCGFSTEVSASQPHLGHRWIDIRSTERGDDNRRVKTSNVPVPCLHCQDAPCAKAAEDGAVYARPDGIVLIDPAKARGQRDIVDACPAGAVYWNEELEIPQKCTMCAHLLDQGYALPRCVEACPNEALFFGDLDDPESDVSRAVAAGRLTPLPEMGDVRTNVAHLNIPTVFLAGSVYLPEDEAAEGASVYLTEHRTGAVKMTKTNYFGDWEFEWLEKGGTYSLEISHQGFRPYCRTLQVQKDHFLGEVMLQKEES